MGDFDGKSSPTQMDFSSAAFWIRMYNLPLACMGNEAGRRLGSSVGRVEEVDTNEEGIGWREYLQVRVEISVHRPIVARGRMLRLKDKLLWIDFQYEKLPWFCFRCGMINHGGRRCTKIETRRVSGVDFKPQYGPWLRAGSIRRGSERESHCQGGENDAMEGKGNSITGDCWTEVQRQRSFGEQVGGKGFQSEKGDIPKILFK